MLVCEHVGTPVIAYIHKGARCIWMTSCLLIWPKRGNDDVHFRFWSNGVGHYET